MNKRIILVVAAGLIIFSAIFLSLPTSYQVTVHNSRFFENCSPYSNTGGHGQCKIIQPSTVIEKREPYIYAWWNKTQIERKFTAKEVSAQWAEGNESIYRKLGTGILKFLAFLIPVLVLAGMLWLLIFTLQKAVRLKGIEQIAWVCLIIFLFPIGSLIFLLAKPKPEK